MLEWIVILVLYVLVLVAFRGLGGFRAAGESLAEWGSATAALTRNAPSPGSALPAVSQPDVDLPVPELLTVGAQGEMPVRAQRVTPADVRAARRSRRK